MVVRYVVSTRETGWVNTLKLECLLFNLVMLTHLPGQLIDELSTSHVQDDERHALFLLMKANPSGSMPNY